MALNIFKRDIEILQAWQRKQKETRQKQAKFLKMILANRSFVISILKESSTGTMSEGGFSLGESKGE